ncbi:unnamed protein product, partial [Ectocarpus sp. 12 AP-2014]
TCPHTAASLAPGVPPRAVIGSRVAVHGLPGTRSRVPTHAGMVQGFRRRASILPVRCSGASRPDQGGAEGGARSTSRPRKGPGSLRRPRRPFSLNG